MIETSPDLYQVATEVSVLFVALLCLTSRPGSTSYRDCGLFRPQFQTVRPSARHGYSYSQATDRRKLSLCFQTSWSRFDDVFNLCLSAGFLGRNPSLAEQFKSKTGLRFTLRGTIPSVRTYRHSTEHGKRPVPKGSGLSCFNRPSFPKTSVLPNAG